MRGYDAFRGYALDSYDSGLLDFYIKPRDVFTDRLKSDRKIELLLQASTTPVRGLVMREMGYSEDDIAEVDAGAQEREAAAMRGLAEAAFNQQGQGDQADMMDEEDTGETVNA
jgi:hypothetical protein